MEKAIRKSCAAAGVDITAGYRSVELMKQYVARTMNEHCRRAGRLAACLNWTAPATSAVLISPAPTV